MGAYTQTAEFFMNPESVPFRVPLVGTAAVQTNLNNPCS